MSSNSYSKSCTPNLGGVKDFYTREEIINLLKLKADKFSTYTKEQVDELIESVIVGTGFATAEQGALADSAVQPEDLGSAAYTDSADYATAEQGELADSALQPEDILYTGSSPTTITVGGLEAGSEIQNFTFSSILEQILTPYVVPSFTSFSISQSSPVEVGTTISGAKSFTFSLNQPGNVNDNSVNIVDITNNVTLATNLGVTDSPANANIGSIQKTTPGFHQWRATATNTQNTSFNSMNATVTWLWRLYSGTSSSPVLEESDIQSLSDSSLTSNKNAIYSFEPGDYKYFAWPDSFGSPSAITGFKDTATNFPVAMANNTDDEAFSNEENGWNYALVNVTNIHEVATDYRVYRTKNALGSSINIQVS